LIIQIGRNYTPYNLKPKLCSRDHKTSISHWTMSICK